MFCARFPNTSQVLVCEDVADVFIQLLHNAHRVCDVIMELDVSGRSSWRCLNIGELARQIDPQVSGISLFAVLWFRIDQSLISTVFLISIPGLPGSDYLPCEQWLWPYNTIQWERREQAFLADDEWSGSSRCVYTWDGIATRFCPLQFENCTCTLCSRNDTRVNDAHLQTLLSNMQKGLKSHNVWRSLNVF